ncbi:uncharacterized protein LOC119114314 isoform X2 [Pollicipes pollicipes]|uniref:uncharacterized protein LOC119114314 isoform X2 n=1 Tax=Pollicipes pollicipes TaxID=41117 RepID=UPI0018849515|nr:uncharacterized protein LOC119114314 isoform X2 [Pollicipes pollicipes]
MAAPVRVVALGQKLVRFHNARTAFNVIHRRWAGDGARRAPRPSEPAEDAPLPFSSSGAATWRARDTFGGGAEEDDTPWYQMPSVLISVTALLVYFCVLREENDIDERLGRDALRDVPGLERQTLEAYVRHEEAAGRTADAERRRLEELLVLESAERERKQKRAPPGPA